MPSHQTTRSPILPLFPPERVRRSPSTTRFHIALGPYAISVVGLRVTLFAHGLPQVFHESETVAEALRVRAEYVRLARDVSDRSRAPAPVAGPALALMA